MSAQRRELEGEEGGDVEGAGLVVAIETVVLALLVGVVDRADAREKATPFIVAVDGEQGVVEIEKCQVHDF